MRLGLNYDLCFVFSVPVSVICVIYSVGAEQDISPKFVLAGNSDLCYRIAAY